MPDTQVPTVNEEVGLEEGLKIMFSKIMIILAVASRQDPETFAQMEDDAVKGFISGLYQNGYEIRPIRS